MIQHSDRTPKYPGRITLIPVPEQPNTYDMVRADEPSNEGTSLNKVLLDEFLSASGATSGSATAYTLSQTGFVLKDGATVRFRLHVDSGATPTLNVNGTGAKSIVTNALKPMKAGTKAGTWVTVIYSSILGFFVLQGSGDDAKAKYGNGPGQISTFELYMNGFNPNYNGFGG